MDGSSIVTAVSSLEATGRIFKALFDLNLNAKTIGQINQLQTAIFEAQRSALTAQADYVALVGRVADFEKEIVRLKDWSAERQNYQLADLGRGSTAYALKPAVKQDQEPHWLCTHCYNNHRKSLLQPQGNIDGETTWQCPSCKSAQKVPNRATPRTVFEGQKLAKLGPGEECPRCRNHELRTESVHSPNEHALEMLGVQIHHMKCGHCDFAMEKQKPG